MDTPLTPERPALRAARGDTLPGSSSPSASSTNTPARAPIPFDMLTPDDLLVRDVLEQREGAWRHFLRRFGSLIRKSIHRTTTRSSFWFTEDDRADLFAGFIASLFEHEQRKLRAHDPAGGCCVASWIRLLAERHTLSVIRTLESQARLRRHYRFAYRRAEQLAPGVEEMLDEKRHVTTVTAAVRTLTPRQRELYELHFERGYDALHVARLMGTSIQTVHTCRHKIALHFARAVEKKMRRPTAG